MKAYSGKDGFTSMGRNLGVFADDAELDRPDLNKCPDCGCFFASDNCPVCGKECPLHMRAGARMPAKKPKTRHRGNGRVSVISWYHSWWFLGFMLFLLPAVGIILLLTSPHKKWAKVLLTIVASIYLLLSSIGIGTVLSRIEDLWDNPVDDSLSKAEYLAKCEEVTPEQFYRSADKGRFVCVKLRVVEKVTCVDRFYNDMEYACYLCEAEGGSSYQLIVRDCLLEDQQRLIPGDVILAYGESAGDREVYDEEYTYTTAPCLNMAYVERK